MTEESIMQHWRFWPVICLVFIFAFSSPIVMLAAPIYFLQQGVEIIIISILSTALTITYSVSPIILNKLSDKLGRRKSVIIAMIGATFAQLVFYITLNPVVFLIERLFEGFILGFFFPNLQASISDNAEIDHQKYLARFNLSWGIAGVFGLLFGTLVLQFINDLRFLFYINPIFMAINVVIAFFFFQEPISDKGETQNIDIDENNSKFEDQQQFLATGKYIIPVIIPLLLILAVSFASGNGTLLYPIKSKILEYQPSSTFLVIVFATATQSLAMYLSSLVALKKLKLLSSLTLLIYAFMFVFFLITENYLIFIILFMFSGFFYGFLYGTASKLFLTLNIVKNTSIYSSISESFMGVSFFISQIFLGFVAGINVNFAYITLSIILVIIFFVSLPFLKKLKEL
ncbi:MAG: MFS transporter [Candidatus Lokiarchaeota archaeon]|nr:MFS transporter [Candidatus Lokiarchaeota archaeon]